MSTVLPEIAAIEKAYVQHIERENRRGPREPHPYIYASRRQKCLRKMVYEATQPEAFPDFDADTKARLAAGKRREIDLTTDLQRIGELCIPKFEFVGQQERVRVYDRNKRLVISGMIDGYVKWESGAVWPVEIKHFSPYTTDRVSTFEDLFSGKWTWPAAHQLLSYLYAKDAPYGLFILGRMGLPRLLPVRLESHLADMEGFLADATTCVDHVAAGTLPDFIDDPDECRSCAVFGSVCQPTVKYDGAKIITDDEMLAQIERHEELKASKKEYDDLHSTISDYCKLTVEKGKKQSIIAGKYVINVGWGKNTTYEIPEALKAQCMTSDPAGKLLPKITRVD